jgi:putative nucleotidyltransferase with HDIG domain
MNRIRVHPALREVARLFEDHGGELCLVGGAVRDVLLGKRAQDWDLATSLKPDEVAAVFRASRPRALVIPTGIKHGTVTVIYKDRRMEITTYRTDASYSDGRRPDAVRYAGAIEDDLSRRDFTMNAVAARLPSGVLIDPFNGMKDIQEGRIRCVGRAFDRFHEDGLRPLRAARFVSQLGFALDAEALAAAAASVEVCARVSAERVRDEIEKILRSPLPSAAFRVMEETGLLALFLPELCACRDVAQKGAHRFDVLDHSLLACDFAARRGYPLEVRAAALLHDAGKPLTRRLGEDGVWTFYRHEAESARLARQLLLRLRWPNGFIDTVCHLIGEHMFHYTDEWSDAAVRRFVFRAGEGHLQNVYRLRMADAFAQAGVEPEPDYLLPLMRRVEGVLAAGRLLSLKDLAVSGDDLAAVGIARGKVMGIILRELLETVLDDPAQNTREALLSIAGRLYERIG